MSPKNQSGGSGQWRRSNLLALGSAAVVAVYAAGFVRTRPAAQAFAQAAQHRPPVRRQIPIEDQGVVASAVIPQGDTALSAPPGAEPTSARPVAAKPAVQQGATPASLVVKVASAPASGVAATTTRPSDSAAASAPVDSTPAKPAETTPTPAPVATVAAATPAADPTPTAAATPGEGSGPSAEAPKKGLRDGTYTGYGRSGHGDIEATISIVGGKIREAAISRCLTAFPCSWIRLLPYQVINRTTADVNNVSRATDSTDAFYYAVDDALSKAR